MPPSAISEVLKDIKGGDDGTYLPKTLFNEHEKSLELLNLAEGILNVEGFNTNREESPTRTFDGTPITTIKY